MKYNTLDGTPKSAKELFNFFKTENLVGITSQEFESSLKTRIGQVDYEKEGYKKDELEQQRDLSIKFHWGHDHDFGSFKLYGRMAERHCHLFDKFSELFKQDSTTYYSKKVLDIGCWTGGTSLLLSTVSSSVTAVEEVVKYSETAQYLADSFDANITVLARSLYSLNDEELFDSYDRVYFPGVIYHLSDPVLALRILYNTLKDEGDILVESAGLDSEEPICRFEGNYIYHANGTREELNRGGWNYFLMSGPALERMMKEAGFVNIEYKWDSDTSRLFAYGKKVKQVGICKAGLSVPEIR